jgi:hypothetical protein
VAVHWLMTNVSGKVLAFGGFPGYLYDNYRANNVE